MWNKNGFFQLLGGVFALILCLAILAGGVLILLFVIWNLLLLSNEIRMLLGR